MEKKPSQIRIAAIVSILAILLSAAAPADMPATRPALSLRESAILRRLGSPDSKERTKAGVELIALSDDGQEDEPGVRAMLAATADADVRSRLKAALQHIAVFKAIGPTLITLHVKDAPPREAFAELFRQAGMPLLSDPPELLAGMKNVKLTADFDRRPFWEVATKLATQAGIDLALTEPEERHLQLRRDQSMPNGPTVVCGPFWVAATKFHYERDIALSTNQFADSGEFTLQLQVFVEPKIAVVSATSEVTVLEATDEHGNSLLPGKDDALDTSHQRDDPGHLVIMDATLNYPKHNAGARLARFRAIATVTVQTAHQTVEISDLLQDKPHSFVLGGETVTFNGCKLGAEGYQVAFKTTVRGEQALEQLGDAPIRDMHAYDADGKELQLHQTGNGGSDVTTGEQYLTATFTQGSGVKPPARLVWNLTTATRDIVVPIEFKDLPMDGIGSH